MYRYAEEKLNNWFHQKRRKPLVLRGARQVGKTRLIRNFAIKNNLLLAEINLEKYFYLNDVFKTLSIENILKEIEGISKCPLNSGNLLIFLDEIQSTPNALQALRYFYEEKPEIPVIAAGSLLEFTLKDHNFSMPVGRIEYFHLGPFTFKEYLIEQEQDLIKYIENYKIYDEIPQIIHNKLLNRLREYTFVGGMPEAILTYSETASFKEVSRVHESISSTYNDDFSKYSKSKDLLILQNVYNQIPRHIGNKVKYTNYSKDYKSINIKNAIHLLIKAKIASPVYHSICTQIPLHAFIKENIYKLIYLDVGLANNRCGLDWRTISSYDNNSFVNQGNIAEQFIGQHLLYRKDEYKEPTLHYWLREGKKSNAELDYVISVGEKIIPIEVKSGKKGTLKSFFQFVHEKKIDFGIRFDLNPPSLQKAEHKLLIDNKYVNVTFNLLSLPLYLVEETNRLIYR